MAAHHNYDRHSAHFLAQYESLQFEQVHSAILPALPTEPSFVLDIGAGSGRDAAWLASKGHKIVAVEPSNGMRNAAKELHPTDNIQWLDDSLPEIKSVFKLGLTYDLILLSAVWMHIHPSSRERSLRKLANLLKPDGRLVISLRLGEPDAEREMHPVSYGELAGLARKLGLQIIETSQSPDELGRKDISWKTVILGLPNDGLGALPLLRNIILRDDKSSTYKIGLLRILARIADVAGGAARYENNSVVLPLGLVSLFWLRMYKPLVENGLPQMPTNSKGTGLGFVKESFRSLYLLPPAEVRVGMSINGETARHFHQALFDIATTIKVMPAQHLFWPASDCRIFEVNKNRRSATPASSLVDDAYMWSFGYFHVPLEIWHALSHYNVWVEPVLVNEWARLMGVYGGVPSVRAQELLAWGNTERDTRIARAAVESVRSAGKPVYCVWSKQRLHEQFEVDHCFPFSVWPCDDLWNLMPTSKSVNLDKSNKLVTAEMLENSADIISEWWANAYTGNDGLARRFTLEAQQTLSACSGDGGARDVLDAMKIHQMRLFQDQQLPLWRPKHDPVKESASRL